jgi:hypothetical protein
MIKALIHPSVPIFHRILVMGKSCALEASNSQIIHRYFPFKSQVGSKERSLEIVMKLS